jgi:hypothetical protein
LYKYSDFTKEYDELGHRKQTDEDVRSKEEKVYHHPHRTVLRVLAAQLACVLYLMIQAIRVMGY